MAFEPEEIREKVKRFTEDMSKNTGHIEAPVLFCLNCGSVNIDQNDVFNVQCYSCRQTELWNGLKFGIARGGSVDDVASMLLPAQEGYWDDWRSQMALSLLEFGKIVSESIRTVGDENKPARQLKSDDYDELKEAWEATKNRIDSFFE